MRRFNATSPAGLQFMSRELEEMANQVRKGKGLTTDDATDLDNIAVLLRMLADEMGA